MSKSLLEQLPHIVPAGKCQAAQVPEQLEVRTWVTLQTNKLVNASKDAGGLDVFGHACREVDGSSIAPAQRSRGGDA